MIRNLSKYSRHQNTRDQDTINEIYVASRKNKHKKYGHDSQFKILLI
jgi:hypothetical protein